ncbi:MAG: nucleotidyltransferase domain-containing protein [Candidatus Woesearchaeota archaeon]
MESKENNVLELFFNEPTREWHFEEILKEARIARSKALGWLRLFTKEDIIKRIKKKGKMPFYTANFISNNYRNLKMIFARTKFYESGFLNHLQTLDNVKTVILFGSFARSDWYKNSDIDIFIYGDPKNLKIAPYEIKLNHNIQLFICKNSEELEKYGAGLIRNIIKGDLIKGDIDFLRVEVNA